METQDYERDVLIGLMADRLHRIETEKAAAEGILDPPDIAMAFAAAAALCCIEMSQYYMPEAEKMAASVIKVFEEMMAANGVRFQA